MALCMKSWHLPRPDHDLDLLSLIMHNRLQVVELKRLILVAVQGVVSVFSASVVYIMSQTC